VPAPLDPLVTPVPADPPAPLTDVPAAPVLAPPVVEPAEPEAVEGPVSELWLQATPKRIKPIKTFS
jgi:hypothetical protein